MNQLLFVYGSLRSGFRTPAYDYLAKYFQQVSEAVVQGRFYDKGQYPVAIPVLDKDSFIQGELYAINNEDEFNWVIEQLDDYEGLNVEAGQQPLYKRERVDVYQNGQTSKAWIYWYNGDTSGMKEISTGDIIKYFQQANNPS